MSTEPLKGTITIITGAGGIEEALELEDGDVINLEGGGILTEE